MPESDDGYSSGLSSLSSPSCGFCEPDEYDADKDEDDEEVTLQNEQSGTLLSSDEQKVEQGVRVEVPSQKYDDQEPTTKTLTLAPEERQPTNGSPPYSPSRRRPHRRLHRNQPQRRLTLDTFTLDAHERDDLIDRIRNFAKEKDTLGSRPLTHNKKVFHETPVADPNYSFEDPLPEASASADESGKHWTADLDCSSLVKAWILPKLYMPGPTYGLILTYGLKGFDILAQLPSMTGKRTAYLLVAAAVIFRENAAAAAAKFSNCVGPLVLILCARESQADQIVTSFKSLSPPGMKVSNAAAILEYNQSSCTRRKPCGIDADVIVGCPLTVAAAMDPRPLRRGARPLDLSQTCLIICDDLDKLIWEPNRRSSGLPRLVGTITQQARRPHQTFVFVSSPHGPMFRFFLNDGQLRREFLIRRSVRRVGEGNCGGQEGYGRSLCHKVIVLPRREDNRLKSVFLSQFFENNADPILVVFDAEEELVETLEQVVTTRLIVRVPSTGGAVRKLLLSGKVRLEPVVLFATESVLSSVPVKVETAFIINFTAADPSDRSFSSYWRRISCCVGLERKHLLTIITILSKTEEVPFCSKLALALGAGSPSCATTTTPTSH